MTINSCLFAVLSGKRCSEMSIVYDDIQAVTRLLQEKEKVISCSNLISGHKLIKLFRIWS